MKTLPGRVVAASAAYVLTASALFVVFRWWAGGHIWSSVVVHDLRSISYRHHFVPPWTVAFAVVTAMTLVASALALGLAGRRAVRPVIVTWAALFTLAGSLLAAVPHLTILATEPGTLGLGHTVSHLAAALIFLGFVLTLRVATPDLFRSSR